MAYVVVVGSLNMDLVVRVPRLPTPGETVLGRDFGTFPGGKGANQAVAAARMGAKVSMLGRVGDDGFGHDLVENLTREGVGVQYISIDENESTGIAMITVDKSGQNSIAVASGANMLLQPVHVKAAWDEIEPPDVLVMPLEVPLDCLMTAAKLAQNTDTTVILNPAPARELSDDFLQCINVVVPNETETSILTGIELTNSNTTIAAARKLQSLGVNQVVLTLGASGALVLDGEEATIEIASHTVDVVDTTAAGDAFVAGLAVAIGEGKSLDDSARIANAAGALATTLMGAQPAMPTRENVLNLLDNERGGL